MIEFRIYYECLEQAHHYIKPIVHSAIIKYETEIKLVRRVGNEKQFPDGVIRAIHSLVKPDILITAVASEKETPLVLIEFTEAVTTEDHELQRLRGAVGAYLARMFYLKVSGPKISKTNFGGAPYNPYSTPRIFAEKLCYEGYIIANWETEPDNPNILKRTPGLPGCPPEIPILKDTIQKAAQAFCENLTDWFAPALQTLQVTESYKRFRAQVNSAPTLDNLLEAWSKREERKSKSPKSSSLNSLRFFVREKQIRAKIYRFSHSMNPDSGIIAFISTLLSDSRSVFGIYALVRPQSSGLLKKDLEDFNLLQPKLNAALEKDKGGIPAWLEKEIQDYVLTKAKTLNDTIDFQGVWEANCDKIMENDVVMTLAYFLDGIYLNYNGVKLKWDRYSLLGGQGGQRGNFIELLRKRLGFDIPSVPSPLKEVVDSVNEDEVTYAIAHRVLLPNSFRVVAVSYPGSQGGWPILPDEKKGKSQPRKYPDIAALPPVNATNFDALINENKGLFNKRAVEDAVYKLQEYRANNAYRKALTKALILAHAITQDGEIKDIVIGVGFGINKQISTTWQPDTVDFIFRIVNRKKWAIGIFRQDLKDLISTIEGATSYPQCFQLSESDACDDLVAASQTSLAFWDNPLDDKDWNDA